MDIAHCRNGHDHGFDIYTGQDTSGGQLVGRVHADSDGLVLRIYDSSDGSELIAYTPDDDAELVESLSNEGYALDGVSLTEISELWDSVNGRD